METTLSKTRVLTEGALMVALATVLSVIPFIELPHGGSITLISMLPLVLMSLRHGVKWGVFTAFVSSLVQLFMGLKNLSYCQTVRAMVGCVLLDYILAFTALGLAAWFAKPFKKRVTGVWVSTLAVCVLRFLCSFFSGYIVWYDYQYALDWMNGFAFLAPLTKTLGEHALCWVYSFFYNASYMLPETVLTVAGALVLYAAMPQLFGGERRAHKAD